MAAKKVSSSTPVDKAIADIKRRYPGTVSGEFKGVRSTTQAVQQFQDVVAESALTDKYNNRTLMAAAAKVATQRFVAYGGGMEEQRNKRKPDAQKNTIRRGSADTQEKRAVAAEAKRTGKGQGYDKLTTPAQVAAYYAAQKAAKKKMK